MIGVFVGFSCIPLNAELNPICHLLALLGGATIVVVSSLRVNMPQICDMGHTALLPFRRKACSGFFLPEKIRQLRPDLNPRSWVPEASTLTTEATGGRW